jgi:hypothetical protein
MANFVTLINQLLVRLNEVTLDPLGDGFNTVRGVQALAKDAINSSIQMILQNGQEWPFLKTVSTQTLVAGQVTYSFPADYADADFDTFFLKKSVSLNNSAASLRLIAYEDYVQNYRVSDDNGPSTGRSTPELVFRTYGSGFGVTPSPNQAYEIEYSYWSLPVDLVAFNDLCVIPDRYNHVIVDGAMMIMMRFRSNEQSAAMHQQNFDLGIRTMRRILLDEPVNIRSTVVTHNAR